MFCACHRFSPARAGNTLVRNYLIVKPFHDVKEHYRSFLILGSLESLPLFVDPVLIKARMAA